MEAIQVGDAVESLSGLPAPMDRVTVGAKVIWVWKLDEQRPTGGDLYWEVHVMDGKVVLSTEF